MKTLDEVIRAAHHCGLISGFDDYYEYDGGCPYEDCSVCEKKRMLGKDIIKYLNEYRKQMTDPDGDHQQLLKCQSLLQELYSNEPLTWSELKTMEGKPVWIEGPFITEGPHWIIVGPSHLYNGKMIGYGKTWQAYRKERS